MTTAWVLNRWIAVVGVPAVTLARSWATTCGALDPHATTCGALDPHASTCGALDPHATTCGALDSRASTCGALDPHATTCGALDPHATTCGALDPSTIRTGWPVLIVSHALLTRTTSASGFAARAASRSAWVRISGRGMRS